MIFNPANEVEARNALEHVKKLIEAGKPFDVTQIRKSRSKWQNKYFHAVCKDMGDHLGYTAQEMKKIITRNCCPVYENNGTKFVKGTSDLDTTEFSEMIRTMQQWAAENFDYYVPDPQQ